MQLGTWRLFSRLLLLAPENTDSGRSLVVISGIWTDTRRRQSFACSILETRDLESFCLIFYQKKRSGPIETAHCQRASHWTGTQKQASEHWMRGNPAGGFVYCCLQQLSNRRKGFVNQ
jgi:hypothetical protein